MIKLCASYGLKMPARHEYSSESFHASAEVELPGNTQGQELKAALHSLWSDLKAAVIQQHGSGAGQPSRTPPVGNEPVSAPAPAEAPARREPAIRSTGTEPASKKQIGFLLALARRKRNQSAEQVRNWLQAERRQNLNTLSKADAAALIDEFNGN